MVILLLVAVLAGAFGPSSNGGAASSSGPMTFKQARPIAKSTIAGYQGGGWALLFAAGYAVNESYTLPVNESASALSSSSCTFTTAPGIPASLTLPAITGNLSSGVASAWMFAYRNGSGNLSLVEVASGHGTILGTLSGSCTTFLGLLSTVPQNVIDSSQAAAAVSALPGAIAFRSTYPNASTFFGILGGVSFLGQSLGSQWTVEYTTCSPAAPSGATGATFNATVNALTGTVISSQTTLGASCSGNPSGTTTPLGQVFSVGLTGLYSNGITYLYNLTVNTAAGGVTWADTTPAVETAGGTPIFTPWSLTVTDAIGTPIAYYNSTTSAWAGASGQAIVTGEGITLSSPVSLSGDQMVFQGNGAFTGTVPTVL